MGKPEIPQDLDAEKAIIGAMLSLDEATIELVEMIQPEDFYDPRCRESFVVISEAHRQGTPIDRAVLAKALEERDIRPTPSWWVDVIASASSAYMTHAQTIIDHKLRRDVLVIVSEAMKEIRSATDPIDVRDRTVADLSQLVGAKVTIPRGLQAVEEILATDIPPEPWVVPGLLRRGWRVVLVAGEGVGKSELLRQFAVASSQAIHPLGFKPLPYAVKVLIVDLENPLGGVHRSMRRLVKLVPEWVPGNIHLWSRPGGIDVRSRIGRAELEAAIVAADPALLLIGPAYKLYRRHNDSDEDAVADVQRIFDDLRTRYGFAMIVEHHAPHGHAGIRDMRPFGTSWWLRWPEFGFGLVPTDPQSLASMSLHRWRGDREQAQWPMEIHRNSGGWPWVGRWPDDGWQNTISQTEMF